MIDTRPPPSSPAPAPSAALRLAIGIALGTLLAACGDGPETPPPGRAAASPKAGAARAEAGAEAVAREARGSLRCPAPPAAARVEGAPVDDVVGVRPGMPWDAAQQQVLCSHPLLVATPDGANRFRLPPADPPVRQGFQARFAEARVHRTGQQVLREMQADAMARANNAVRHAVAPGQARWYVGTMGLPGEEQVTHVQREERYAADAMPPMDGVLQALRAKYGEPTRRSGDGRTGRVEWAWVHDPAGRRVGAQDRLASQCGLTPSPDAGVGLSEACGVVVAATLQAPADNPGLVEWLRVGSVDQARGYARVAATEQALRRREAERQARQVRDAGRQTAGPTL